MAGAGRGKDVVQACRGGSGGHDKYVVVQACRGGSGGHGKGGGGLSETVVGIVLLNVDEIERRIAEWRKTERRKTKGRITERRITEGRKI